MIHEQSPLLFRREKGRERENQGYTNISSGFRDIVVSLCALNENITLNSSKGPSGKKVPIIELIYLHKINHMVPGAVVLTPPLYGS